MDRVTTVGRWMFVAGFAAAAGWIAGALLLTGAGWAAYQVNTRRGRLRR